jgi:hypothetical protein
MDPYIPHSSRHQAGPTFRPVVSSTEPEINIEPPPARKRRMRVVFAGVMTVSTLLIGLAMVAGPAEPSDGPSAAAQPPAAAESEAPKSEEPKSEAPKSEEPRSEVRDPNGPEPETVTEPEPESEPVASAKPRPRKPAPRRPRRRGGLIRAVPF